MKRLMQLLRDNAALDRKPLALVRNEGETAATIYIYDVIDPYWGIGAHEVAKAVAGLDATTTLHVRINSPGGDVFEARAIAAAIQQHPGTVVAHIDGLAASAATTIALAAGEVEIVDGGFFMVHEAWSIVLGNKHDMTAMAGLLVKVDDTLANDYMKKTKKSRGEVDAWMAAETWFTAQEAVDAGFADRLVAKVEKTSNRATGQPQAARFNLAAYDKTPVALLQAPAKQAEADAAAQLAHNARRLALYEID